jgi:magnesium chelatase family protein
MPLATVYSRALDGLAAQLITIEVHLAGGLPGMTIVGMADLAVREAKDRVKSAIQNSGFEFPARRITVNLAPADLPKDGAHFDLAIAVGILAANGQVDANALNGFELLGELALSGEVRSVRGSLPAALHIAQTGRELILPAANGAEAALASQCIIAAASHLNEVVAHINKLQTLPRPEAQIQTSSSTLLDIADVRGQQQAKRALLVAAAGRHSMLMLGPPGSGKSMLAARLPSLLPPMDETSALEVASIHSVAGRELDLQHWLEPPFRAPHHTASAVAMVGGGSNPRPGEISLAHHGILFLDELAEYDRKVLEVLREPLENRRITISRAARQVEFPANFLLIAAMNPSPSGHEDGKGNSQAEIIRYRSKVSAPILNRIDLLVSVPRVERKELLDAPSEVQRGPSSAELRQQVIQARQIQLNRCGKPNGEMSVKELDTFCEINAAGKKLLEASFERLNLSARGLHRVIKVARTCADLDGSEHIEIPHLSEALGYRRLEATFHSGR